MRAVTYIGKESLKLAEDMERKFMSLTAASGVLFVGIVPVPTEDGDVKVFEVTVGVDRILEAGTAKVLADALLSADLPAGVTLHITPVRGISVNGAIPLNTH